MTVVEKQKNIIEANWETVCDEARLNKTDRKLLWQRQLLNPFAFEGLRKQS
jgi:serine/threonine-protein kinase HipA